MPDKSQDRVLIVDFGSQVTQLIARRVREAGVYSEIVPYDKAEAALAEKRPRAIILSGGPASVHETGTPQAPQALFNAGVPVLGICYGEQAMVAALGGEVEGGHHREFGRAELQIIDETPLFDGVFKDRREGAGVDEPRRPRDAAAARLPRRRHLDRRAVRGDRRRFAPALRRAVPSRGGAHAERRGAARQFRPHASPVAPATGPWRSSARARSRASASRWATGW